MAGTLTACGIALLWWSLSAGAQSRRLDTTQPPLRPEYETRAIEQLREGDLVLARDEHGRELGLKRIVETYERTSDHLRILTFESEDGTRQTLKTTDEHPFWSVGESEFVEASDLAVGDQVTGPHGELQDLVATIYEPHPEGIAVYNFQVEDYHTYFVNDNGTRGPPLLVHNADYLPERRRLDPSARGDWQRLYQNRQVTLDDLNKHLHPDDVADILDNLEDKVKRRVGKYMHEKKKVIESIKRTQDKARKAADDLAAGRIGSEDFEAEMDKLEEIARAQGFWQDGMFNE